LAVDRASVGREPLQATVGGWLGGWVVGYMGSRPKYSTTPPPKPERSRRAGSNDFKHRSYGPAQRAGMMSLDEDAEGSFG
jgi:hypothetical protein